MFAGYAPGAPSKNVMKKASQALNDLSSCLRFCKQLVLRQLLGAFGLRTTKGSLGRINQRLICKN